jgi:hypothetical protein
MGGPQGAVVLEVPVKLLMSVSLVVITSTGCVGTIETENLSPPDAAPPTPPAPVDAPPDRFKVGDPFDYGLVSPQSQMIATMLKSWSYTASTAPKAIAINKLGLGFVSIKPNSGEGDPVRTALEGCFVIGGGLPCTILADGNVFSVSDHALARADSYNFQLASPATLADLPFVTTKVRTTDVAAYAAASGFKAIAVSVDGTTSITQGQVVGSQGEVNRIMLERCEMQAALTPCLLFATGNTPVLDVSHPTFVPQIDFARTTVQTNLPGTTNQNFNQFIPSYLNDVNSGLAGAIFLAPRGQGAAFTGNNASANAKATCTAHLVPGDPPCFPYATGRTITFKATDLAAYKTSADVHCLAMPRANCAAHMAIGCSAGMLYTTHTGSVALEACN